jgi:hypothetical protein
MQTPTPPLNTGSVDQDSQRNFLEHQDLRPEHPLIKGLIGGSMGGIHQMLPPQRAIADLK